MAGRKRPATLLRVRPFATTTTQLRVILGGWSTRSGSDDIMATGAATGTDRNVDRRPLARRLDKLRGQQRQLDKRAPWINGKVGSSVRLLRADAITVETSTTLFALCASNRWIGAGLTQRRSPWRRVVRIGSDVAVQRAHSINRPLSSHAHAVANDARSQYESDRLGEPKRITEMILAIIRLALLWCGGGGRGEEN